ncbi:recombinase family protein [Sphingobium sp. PNB]|uniref:recombinase family protein n=1 Tax=Sphingobium sp. PNB TaxID=863934 RepID=UPI001CA439D0|nr:recombinase family protein [Sphingobium sp. PNB]MCB4862999.1 recombinase family protein [Sphingobium sp. PNB]
MTAKPRLIGYIRVSTAEQSTDLQWDALRAANCHKIYQDKVSGTRWTRKGLSEALEAVRPGDKLVIWRIDRLGRSLGHILSVIDDLGEQGSAVISLSENCDTSTENGEMQAIFLAVVAHMEYRAIVRRTRAGVEAAARRGKHRGGRPKMSPAQIAEAQILMKGGTMKASAVAKRYRVGRATLFRNLKRKVPTSLAA